MSHEKVSTKVRFGMGWRLFGGVTNRLTFCKKFVTHSTSAVFNASLLIAAVVGVVLFSLGSASFVAVVLF
jgi:hypothetical protein